ncbi:MAG: hypothetical protein AAF616_10730 [Bacteroidota bacterium]
MKKTFMKHFADHVSVRHWVAIASLLLSFCFGWSQDIAVDTWRTHFSYQNARILVSTGQKLFCAVENGLFSVERDGEVRRLSKLDGLSGAGISAMDYNAANNVLIIGYVSGLVDLIYEDRIVTLREIAETDLEGNKEVKSISTRGGSAYLGSDFGVIVVDLIASQISENFIQIGSAGTQVTVSEIVTIDDLLFVKTENGVQSGDLALNLLDFNNWVRYPDTEVFGNLVLSGAQLFAVAEGFLFGFENGEWASVGVSLPIGAQRLFAIENEIYTAVQNDLFRLGSNDFELIESTPATSVNDLIEFEGALLVADAEKGLIGTSGEQFSPSGPLQDSYSNIAVLGSEIFAFHVSNASYFDAQAGTPSFSQFVNGSWQIISIDGFSNVSDVTEYRGVRYFSSVGDGIYNASNDEIFADIPGSNPAPDSIFSSLSAGRNLWLGGAGTEPLHTLDRDGNWDSFSATSLGTTDLRKVKLSTQQIPWSLTSSGGLVLLNTEESQVLDQLDGITSTVNDFDLSVEDNAWIATSSGPALLPSASFAFFNSQTVRPTFEGRVLFEGQQINSIVTDGGNRVWLGTDEGLWVYDENTTEQVALFTEDNSPLPSNVILSLTYDGTTGEISIQTDRGLVSYRSASSDGSLVHQNVNIFPNPVRPDYTGQVGISGLANNASLKITDINGHLVKELEAAGGTAAWDTRDITGNTVVSGIYFFFSATDDGDETFIGKIAVIR